MGNKDLIGKKVKGFKFDDDKYKGLDYNRAMDSCIGEIGEIVSYYHPFDCYYVEFINKKWSYPASLIEQHLVEESPKPITPKTKITRADFERQFEIID
jgi:hypothetical protein